MQLADQTRRVHAGAAWVDVDPDAGIVRLTRIYLWFAGDFEQVAGSVLDFAAGHVPALRRMLDAGRRPKLAWLEYDWALNAQ